VSTITERVEHGAALLDEKRPSYGVRISLHYRLFSQLVIDPGGCLLWQGRVSRDGYGRISVDGRTRQVHRVTWELFNGPIPEGLEPDHLCRVRRCAAPDHLELVTHRENMLRGQTIAAFNAAKTRCPSGHPYDALNTAIRANGDRRCLECDRIRGRRRYWAKKGVLI
jgi:HNH endonuclease